MVGGCPAHILAVMHLYLGMNRVARLRKVPAGRPVLEKDEVVIERITIRDPKGTERVVMNGRR